MTFWWILGCIFLLALIVVTYLIRRSGLRYEQKPLRDILSDEMKLVLRNERTVNLAKKRAFDKQLKDAGEARIQPSGDAGDAKRQ